jgi:hypothetical protein
LAERPQYHFIDFHRAASEELIAATKGERPPPDVVNRLDEARRYSRLAEAAATNRREVALEIGFREVCDRVQQVAEEGEF